MKENTMHYIMLIYHGTFWDAPKEEKNRIHDACGAWHQELVDTGKTAGAHALQPVDTATTLRWRDGKPVLTDGPYAETKEVLGGFEILQCENLDEALAIAKRFPALAAGATVEVRPMIMGGTCKEE